MSGASPYSGDALARHVPYVAAVGESTLAALAGASELSASQLEAGVAGLRALPAMPGAEIGWVAGYPGSGLIPPDVSVSGGFDFPLSDSRPPVPKIRQRGGIRPVSAPL